MYGLLIWIEFMVLDSTAMVLEFLAKQRQYFLVSEKRYLFSRLYGTG